MSILSSAAMASIEVKRWDQNPLLAIGLTPCILRAGFSDDDLFAICQKQARKQLVEAHPDRTNEENEEQRIFSTAFGFLKDRTSFDLALYELRRIAATEEREVVRIKREARHLRETQEAALKQAELVSQESVKLKARIDPLERFLKSLMRVQALQVVRTRPEDWAPPSLITKVTYTYLWGHSTTSAARNAVSIENLLTELHERALKEGGFPWGLVGENKPRAIYGRVFGTHAVSGDAAHALTEAYPASLLKLKDLCESIRLKSNQRTRVHTDEAACGMRTSAMTPDGILHMRTGGKSSHYRIFGSVKLPSSVHGYPTVKFGDSGLIEIPWETAIRWMSPVLAPDSLLIGMRVKEVKGRDALNQKPTAEMFQNMQQHPLTVLGSILAIE